MIGIRNKFRQSSQLTKTLGTFWKKGPCWEFLVRGYGYYFEHESSFMSSRLFYYTTTHFFLIIWYFTYILTYLQDWSLLQKGQLWWPSALQPLWWTPAFKGRITTPRTYAKPNMRKVGQQQRKQSKLGMLMYTTLLLPKNGSSIYTLSFCRTKMVFELSKINLD